MQLSAYIRNLFFDVNRFFEIACLNMQIYESLWLKHGLDSLIRMSEWNILSLNMQQLSEISNK